jgi:prepilin-type N-terminal cleavage/methylation domain-containing protein
MQNKKAFTLMEVIISVVLLSVVMITLLQIKSENIFMVSKSDERAKINDYILMAIDFNDTILDKNENINIENKYKFENEKLRAELKDIKVSIKDENLDSLTLESNHNSLNFTTYYRSFFIENSDIKKKIYTFKFEL